MALMLSCYLMTQTHQSMKLRHNVYEDFYEDKGLFDFSEYPKDSQFYDPANEKNDW